MNKILVTPRSVTKEGHPALDILKEGGFEVVFSEAGKQPSEEDLLSLLPGCEGYLAGVEKITERVLRSAPGLKVISRNGVGIDNIDIDVATELKIRICKTEGANSRGVAELTISLILALARSVPFSDHKLKSGVWDRRIGMEVKGKNLGIIGCGKIGREVAAIALAMGINVIVYDPFSEDSFTADTRFRYTDMDILLQESDIISLHLPVPKNKKPLFDKPLFDKLKKKILLVNTSRAELIDNEALNEALENGSVSGFATDVFLKEPPEDLTLIKNSRVIATPHIGGFTSESVDNSVYGAVENLLKYLK